MALTPASAGAAACANTTVHPASTSIATIDKATLCLLNAERTKRGLSALRQSKRLYRASVGHSRDMRYSKSGNEVLERHVVTTGSMSGPALLVAMRDTISSAMYRIHPDREKPIEPEIR